MRQVQFVSWLSWRSLPSWYLGPRYSILTDLHCWGSLLFLTTQLAPNSSPPQSACYCILAPFIPMLLILNHYHYEAVSTSDETDANCNSRTLLWLSDHVEVILMTSLRHHLLIFHLLWVFFSTLASIIFCWLWLDNWSVHFCLSIEPRFPLSGVPGKVDIHHYAM